MADFTPSVYQQNFFDWTEQGAGSCVLVAVAGSGKTTSVIEALRYVRAGASVRLLAFNTTIAAELNARVAAKFAAAVELGDATLAARYAPQRVSASTFHGLCFGAVRKHLAKRGVVVGKPDGHKVAKLALEALREVSEWEVDAYAEFAAKLVGLARGEGIGPLVPDTEDAWYELVKHHDLQLDVDGATEAAGIAHARALLRLSNEAALRGSVDFDDMLYQVVNWRLRLWQNDWVFVDEAQDTNPVRRAIVKLALRPGGRLVAVGDPRQAIYGFTGASHDAIDLIKREFNAVELPLTVSYRCAKSIVALAQTVVPHIEAHAGAPDGRVETLPLDRALAHLAATDAVLCRQTAPLIKLAFTLIARGTGCRVLGRDLGAGLVALVKKARARGVDALVEKLCAYRDREVAKFTAKGEEGKAEGVTDRVECVLTVVDSLPEGGRTIPALIAAIERLFDDRGGVLTLSTVHKAKGKEWATVAILQPELMPSRWARQDWQALQEQNLMYVAYTRAKEHLIFLETPKKEV